MATTHRKNRNHHKQNKRAFPDEHPDVPLSACLFVYDGKLTINRDAALAARRSGRAVKASAEGVAIGGSVRFDAAGSHAQVGSTLTYFWNFNDGATATGPQATHTFAAPGKGFVALIVTDGRGARAASRPVPLSSPRRCRRHT